MRNRRWLLVERPLGRSIQASDFKWDEVDVGAPGAGDVLVKTLHLGFDPAQKGWMENVADYMAPTQIGDVVPAFGVGEVVASNSDRLAVGDKVTGMLGWQDYALSPAHALTKVPDDEFLTANLGALGTTGMTAFFGLHKVGRPFPGDTMVVTGAAGATGSVVGQIGKIAGCRVIGIAGGERKCKWLTDEVGFDAAIDYKSANVRRELKALAPNGVDVVWDNVGGPIFNDVISRIADDARIVVCGAISIYSAAQLPPGPSSYMNLVFRRARMEGFIVLDHVAEFPWARRRLIEWIRDGRLKFGEDQQFGLENAPQTLMRLFDGANFGKQILTLNKA